MYKWLRSHRMNFTDRCVVLLGCIRKAGSLFLPTFLLARTLLSLLLRRLFSISLAIPTFSRQPPRISIGFFYSLKNIPIRSKDQFLHALDENNIISMQDQNMNTGPSNDEIILKYAGGQGARSTVFRSKQLSFFFIGLHQSNNII